MQTSETTQLRPKGRSLADILNHIAEDPDDEFALECFEDLDETVAASLGFRYKSTSTQSRQDRHLAEFLDVYRMRKRLQHLSQEEVKALVFAEPPDEIIKNARLYLAVAMKLIRPRSNRDPKPRYQTLLQRRLSLQFWVFRELANPPSRARFLNSTNETLQFAGRKYGVNKTRRVKAYLGRVELQQLIDLDVIQSPYLPVSENHHLAWTLACICGVRPGSLGWAKHRREDYLRWEDISITRGAAKGMFNAKVLFRHLKGNRDDLENEHELEFCINSPTVSDHLPLSPAHRMLVMLLRRGALKDYTTLDDLLNDDRKAIQIHPQYLKRPVLLAGGPRGLSITDNAISSGSLSDYISKHAMDHGYERGTSMYAWRRKAGTEFSRQRGIEATKTFMGHVPRSDTYIKHYDQGNFDVPVFEIAMRLDTHLSEATMDEDASPALYRFVDRTRLEGVFLQQAANQLAIESVDLNDALARGDAKAVRNARRRLRRYARQALHDEEKRTTEAQMTSEAFERRKQELKQPMALTRLVQQHARNLLASSAQLQEARLEQAVQGCEDDDNADLSFEDVRDAEDDVAFESPQPRIAAVSVDAEQADDDEPDGLDFFESVRLFMECSLQETFVLRDPGRLRCQLCINDDTMTATAKARVWTSSAKLQTHQLSREHYKKQTWIRRIDALAAESSSTKRYSCPYPHASEYPRYTNRNKLIEHINQSTATSTSREHDEAKRLDGWYDVDWSFDVVASNPQRVRQERRSLGLTYSNETESPVTKRVKVETSFEVMVGAGGHPFDISEVHSGVVFGGDDPRSQELLSADIPSALRGIIFDGNDPRSQQIVSSRR